jgi:antitoxin (DNA-binding transcriptional repressor) of toxin-antitoxin stability system
MTAVVAIQMSVRELKTNLCEWLARAQAGKIEDRS